MTEPAPPPEVPAAVRGSLGHVTASSGGGAFDRGDGQVRSPVPDLVRMLDQIARNFSHHPFDKAAGEVAQHLTSFWSPRMLSDLRKGVAGGEQIHPIAREALGLLAR